MKKTKTEFLKIYANLPLGIRKEVIAVIGGEPMTWRVCCLEIQEETKMGDRILTYLDKLKLI